MMAAKYKACETCFYWKQTVRKGDTRWEENTWEYNGGECRLNPPVIVGCAGGPADGGWPFVRDTDWCGHWDDGANFSDQRPRIEDFNPDDPNSDGIPF